MYWCSCKAKTKTVCPQHGKQKRKEKKGGACSPGVRRGQSEARHREKGANRGRWVSGSARQGGGHEGWWQGEHRAPWAMSVEGNGGISKRDLEFEEKEKEFF